MSKFNGHKNWNHWNVSLWLNNDASLYARMIDEVRFHKSKDIAARIIFFDLKENEVTHTPDGAPYSITTIRAAMRGLDA